MQAIPIIKNGTADSLKVQDWPIPEVQADEVRITVKAFGLNFADIQAAMVDSAGFVTITISAGQTIRLDGLRAADLSAANFMLDGNPAAEQPDTGKPNVAEDFTDLPALAQDFVAAFMVQSGTIDRMDARVNDFGLFDILDEDGLESYWGDFA